MQQKIFYTIREVAGTGLLSEYCLRKKVRAGDIPCIYSGNRCLINLEMLMDMINTKGSPLYSDKRR